MASSLSPIPPNDPPVLIPHTPDSQNELLRTQLAGFQDWMSKLRNDFGFQIPFTLEFGLKVLSTAPDPIVSGILNKLQIVVKAFIWQIEYKSWKFFEKCREVLHAVGSFILHSVQDPHCYLAQLMYAKLLSELQEELPSLLQIAPDENYLDHQRAEDIELPVTFDGFYISDATQVPSPLQAVTQERPLSFLRTAANRRTEVDHFYNIFNRMEECYMALLGGATEGDPNYVMLNSQRNTRSSLAADPYVDLGYGDHFMSGMSGTPYGNLHRFMVHFASSLATRSHNPPVPVFGSDEFPIISRASMISDGILQLQTAQNITNRVMEWLASRLSYCAPNALPVTAFDVEMQRNKSSTRVSLAKLFINLAVQTTIGLIAVSYQISSDEIKIEPPPATMLVVKVAMVIGFTASFIGLLLNHSYPSIACYMENWGSVSAAMGLLVLMSLLLPANFGWIIWLACGSTLLAYLARFIK